MPETVTHAIITRIGTILAGLLAPYLSSDFNLTHLEAAMVVVVGVVFDLTMKTIKKWKAKQ